MRWQEDTSEFPQDDDLEFIIASRTKHVSSHVAHEHEKYGKSSGRSSSKQVVHERRHQIEHVAQRNIFASEYVRACRSACHCMHLVEVLLMIRGTLWQSN